jgi:tRNA A-37 threonylcarbamoyl transferase component Bud32
VRSSAEKREQRRGVTDSAGSAEVREQRVKANASAVVRESEAADTLRSSGNGAAELSPFMAAAREAREARKALGASEQCSASRSSGATSSSLEDTFGELGACSGRAMNRLSQHYSRRLSSSNGRGSAELDRRQSLTYMKEVDAIVQSFDIQEDEIEIEMKADGSDHVLGHGSYGQVYKGIRGGVQEVAVKVLFDVDERTLRNFIQEISLLKSLNYDRNIVQFYGARLRNGQIPMMVLEFMEGGDLRTAIDDDYNGHLKWNMKGFSLALDIVKGIHFLHSHNVIHSDLKTSNVLLDRSKSTAKISDVGLARVMEKKQYRSSDEHAWTFVYAAPEMLMGRACSAASDVYSLGVCLWELVMREMPLRGRLSKPKCPQDCPQPVADLITQCLKTDPELRPTAREVHDTIKAAHSSVAKASAWFA